MTAERQKADYYNELEHAPRGSVDVTRWVVWFLGLFARAVSASEVSLGVILAKARFWRNHAQNTFNAHQTEMLNRLLDGFTGNLTSSKWAKICKVSQDTASREIKAHLECGILVQRGAGRSTHYVEEGLVEAAPRNGCVVRHSRMPHWIRMCKRALRFVAPIYIFA